MINIKDGHLKLGTAKTEVEKVIFVQDAESLLAMAISPNEQLTEYVKKTIAMADLATIMSGLIYYLDRDTAVKVVTEACGEFLKRVREEKANGEVAGSKVSPKDI